MNKVKQINHPILANAARLTPLQLNEIRCNSRHTVLTPELLEQMASAAKGKKKAAPTEGTAS